MATYVVSNRGSSQRKPFLDRCNKIDSWRGGVMAEEQRTIVQEETGETVEEEEKLDRVVDEAANRRRVVRHWSNLRDRGAHTILSFFTPAGIWHFDELASGVPTSVFLSLRLRTRAGSRMHRIRVKGAGYFLRGTFGILERKTSWGRDTW